MPKYNASKLLLRLGLWCGLLLGIVAGTNAKAQSRNDILLVKQTAFYTEQPYYKRAGNSDSIMQLRSRNKLAACNPVALLMKGSMFVYQHVLTQQLARTCPYEISCSNYSKQAIHEYGLLRGVLISADRLLRCNRISATDLTPLDFNEKTGAISDDLNKYR